MGERGIWEWFGYWVWAYNRDEALELIAEGYLDGPDVTDGIHTLRELGRHRMNIGRHRMNMDLDLRSDPSAYCRRVPPSEQIEMVAGWGFDNTCLMGPFVIPTSTSVVTIVRLAAIDLEEGLRTRSNRSGIFYRTPWLGSTLGPPP